VLSRSGVRGQPTDAAIEAPSDVILHDCSAKFGATGGFASVVDFFDLRVLTR
jgi:hypothetical protein